MNDGWSSGSPKHERENTASGFISLAARTSARNFPMSMSGNPPTPSAGGGEQSVTWFEREVICTSKKNGSVLTESAHESAARPMSSARSSLNEPGRTGQSAAHEASPPADEDSKSSRYLRKSTSERTVSISNEFMSPFIMSMNMVRDAGISFPSASDAMSEAAPESMTSPAMPPGNPSANVYSARLSAWTPSIFPARESLMKGWSMKANSAHFAPAFSQHSDTHEATVRASQKSRSTNSTELSASEDDINEKIVSVFPFVERMNVLLLECLAPHSTHRRIADEPK